MLTTISRNHAHPFIYSMTDSHRWLLLGFEWGKRILAAPENPYKVRPHNQRLRIALFSSKVPTPSLMRARSWARRCSRASTHTHVLVSSKDVNRSFLRCVVSVFRRQDVFPWRHRHGRVHNRIRTLVQLCTCCHLLHCEESHRAMPSVVVIIVFILMCMLFVCWKGRWVNTKRQTT